MKNKTAMTELKEKLQIVVNDLADSIPSTFESNYRIAMQNVINDIDAQMLQLEREQIGEAYKDGYVNACNNRVISDKFYYQQKYENEK